MRILIYFFTGLVLLLTVVSCGRKVTASTSTTVKDSTNVTVIERPVEIKLPGDTIEITKWIECDSLTNKPKPFVIEKKSGRTTVRLDLDSKGLLTTTCAEDSFKTIINALDKTIFNLRHEQQKKVEVVTEFKTRRIDIICRWIAGIALLLLLIKLYLKFIKPV